MFWCRESGFHVFLKGLGYLICLLSVASWGWYTSLPRAAVAADWSLNPDIEAMTEYNDNVLFSHVKKIDDFIARITPGIHIQGRTEKTLFSVNSLVTGEKYLDNSQLDTINTHNNVLLEHYWNPRFMTSIKGMFVKDETLEEELEAAGRPGLRRPRYRYGFDASGKYSLSDTLSLTLGGGPQYNNYPDGPYADLTSWQVYLDPAVALDPMDTVGLFINYDHADYKDSSTVKTVSASLYYRRDLSETAYFVLGGGYRYTWTEYSTLNFTYYVDPDSGLVFIVPAKKDQSSGDGGFIFNFELENDWTERFSTIAAAGREHYNSVEATSTDLTYARATFRYRWTDTISSSLRLSYDTTDEVGPGSRDNNNIRVEPYLSWALSPTVTVKMGGSYRYDREDARPKSYNIQRFRGWLNLSYNWPRLAANH